MSKFKTGNKVATINKGKKKGAKSITKSVRELFRAGVNWEKILKILVKESEGYKIKNYNTGKEVDVRPSLAAITMLMDYAWGKPTMLVDVPDADTIKNTQDAIKASQSPESDVSESENSSTDCSTPTGETTENEIETQ
jgi:hypothetical protein